MYAIRSYYVNMDFTLETVAHMLQPLLEDEGITKLLYDAKSVIPMLRDYSYNFV